MLRLWCWIRCLQIASVARDLGLGESVVGRWVKLERERRQAVRELEKENEILGKPATSSHLGTKTPALLTVGRAEGFLLNHLDGRCFRGHARRLLRVENRASHRGERPRPARRGGRGPVTHEDHCAR